MAVAGIPFEKIMSLRAGGEFRLYNSDENYYVGLKGNGSGSAASLYFFSPSGNIAALTSVGGLSIGSVTLPPSGVVNAHVGFRVAGVVAALGTYLRGNASSFVASAIQVGDLPTAPSPSQYFGTNSGGTPGFFDLPSGGGSDADTVDEETLQTTTADEENLYASNLSAAGVAYVNIRICARWLIAPSTYHGYVYENQACVRWNGLSLIVSTGTAVELGTGVGSVTVSITSSGANFVINVTGNGQTVEWKAIITHFSV